MLTNKNIPKKENSYRIETARAYLRLRTCRGRLRQHHVEMIVQQEKEKVLKEQYARYIFRPGLENAFFRFKLRVGINKVGIKMSRIDAMISNEERRVWFCKEVLHHSKALRKLMREIHQQQHQ